MAIQWSGTSGHLRVGIDIRHDPIGPSTTHVNVYVDFWIQTQAWGYNDNQVLDIRGSLNHQHAYSLNSADGETKTVLLLTHTIPAQGLSYGGGPTYSFTATVGGAFDGSAPSVQRTWTLPARQANVPTAPPIIRATNVTSDSAGIYIAPADGRGSGITEYQVQVDDNSNFSSPVADKGGGSIGVTGLAPATTYYARARARNAIGWGPWTQTISFRTGASAPNAPTGLASGTVGQTTASVTFTAPFNGGSPIQNYTIQFATNAAFTQNLRSIVIDGSPFTVTALLPGTQYWARVRANNGVGSSPYSTSITFSTLAGTPRIVSPVNGSTVGTAIGQVVLEAFGVTREQRITVEFSRTSDFSSVQTATLEPTSPTSNNRYTVGLGGTQGIYLVNGQWYARAKVTNTSTGYITPWSTTVAFVQSHTPSASAVAPTAGVTMSYSSSVQFSWRFTDAGHPNEWQTAYRLVIENNDTGATIYDSGKTALASTTTDAGRTVTRSVAMAQSLKNIVMRWRVMVWDRGDQASPWSGYSLFILADPPAITVISPAPGLSVDTGAPTFAWSTVIPSGGTQVYAKVEVYDQENNQLVWDGEVQGAGTTVSPGIVILTNGRTYTYTLRVVDSTGLAGTATGSFLTEYVAPPSVAYSIYSLDADDDGYIEVNWNNTDPDPSFVEWKVYRKFVGEDWELISTIPNENTRSYRDYMLIAGKNYSYSVTQTAIRSGVILESPVGYYVRGGSEQVFETRTFSAALTHYWLIEPNNSELNVRLDNVISDPRKLEFESATYTIIGRGRHKDYGDELGYSGTLTLDVKTNERTSSMVEAVERLRRSQRTFYLRTPFGKLYPVGLGDLDWEPLAGVGVREMGTLTIPYEQVG